MDTSRGWDNSDGLIDEQISIKLKRVDMLNKMVAKGTIGRVTQAVKDILHHVVVTGGGIAFECQHYFQAMTRPCDAMD
jgi:hypothetical protein